MLFKDNKLTVLNSFDLDEISTKGFVGVLNGFAIDKTLLVIDGDNRNLELVRPQCKACQTAQA